MSKEKHTEPEVGYPSGTVFGDTYRINRLVGLGGMGEVYEVEHLRTHGKLALKVLNPMYSVDDKAIERFRREARMAAGVDHESIVHVFDVDQDSSGVWFIAMELLEGQTLKEVLTREKVLTIKRALWIADRVSKALSSVHEKGIVHRDIKPANIFLSKAGTIVQVKIMDFGVSKFAHSQSRLSIGLVVGTPRYMSPEQACGEDVIDHKVDMFSLAAVIYRALTGVGPFDARTAPEVLDKILTRDPPPPSQFNSEVTKQMDWAIMKALSKDPERRFGSIDLFRDALCRDQKFTGAFKIPPGGVVDLSMSSVMTAPQMSAEAFREMRRVTILSVSIDAEAYKAGGHGRSNSFYETVADHVGQMQGIIEAHGGMVEKTFTGSMIAVFGAPKSKVDDALQAVRAALALKHTLSKQDLILRIGLSTGRVMAGRLIDEGGRYSVTGGALNLARRIEGVNDTGGVLVDQETYFQIRGRFRTKLISIMEGREEERRTRGPVTVYEVTGEHAFGFVVSYREVLGMYAVTVGRDAELEHLKAQLHRSLEEGIVETALIVAPGGMGKSRLVNEMRAYVEDSTIDPYTLMAEGNSQTSDIPFALLSEIIKTKAQISSKDDANAMKSKLKDFVAVAQDKKTEEEDFINQTYSMVLQIEPARQDDQDIGNRLKVAFRGHLESILKQAPVLIILEDLQWADEKSMEVLFSVADNIKSAQMFILGTASPDVFDRFNSAQFMGFWQNVMKLKPLSLKESEDLIQSIMRTAPPPRLVEHIFEISEGNPLFIEEFLQSLADRGLLVYGDDCWQILDRGWRDILPGGVEAVIQSRLDELKRDELNLMRKAAVCGNVFWDKALEALDEINIERKIEALSKRELILAHPRSSIPGTREFRFKNSITSKVAYTGLTEDRQRTYHYKLAKWLESTGLNTVEMKKLIAHNYTQGGREDEAARIYYQLGQACGTIGGEYHEALKYFDRALDLARKSGNRDLEHDALGQVGIMSSKLGMFDKADELLDDVIRLAADDGDTTKEAIYTRELALVHACRGYFDEALDTVNQAKELTKDKDAPAIQLEIESTSGLIHILMADYKKAIEHYKRAYELAEKTDNTYKIANILHNIGHCFYSMMDFSKAGEYFESSVLICEREGFYSLRYINLAYIYYLNILRTSDGTFVDKMHECLSFARRFYDNWGLIQIRILMGRSHAHLKQKEKAAECFKLAIADARKYSFSSFVEEAEKALEELGKESP